VSDDLLTNHDYLANRQYRDTKRLDARTALHARFSRNQYGWFRWVYDHIEKLSARVILDVGCGSGSLWEESAARVPQGTELWLCDLSAGMVRSARGKLRTLVLATRASVADAQNLPFASESVDLVLANHMLYHVPELDVALSEIHRVLRPGGILLATTVGSGHLRQLRELLDQFLEGGSLALPTSFILENGEDVLRRRFTDVRRYLYDDEFLVTEVEPLVAYALSLATRGDTASVANALRREIADQLSERGIIRIAKESGLFTARRSAKAAFQQADAHHGDATTSIEG